MKEDISDKDLERDEFVETDNLTNNQTEENAGDEASDNVTDWEAKDNELNNSYLRLNAEFDNYRKRTMKEKAELIKNGGEKSISSILPVVDDMERAVKMMETATDITAVREGMELIFNKFISTLGQNGVKAIESIECDFNTDFHEAIATIPAPTEELKGKILDCVQTGYLLNEKVIRHAKVVVGE